MAAQRGGFGKDMRIIGLRGRQQGRLKQAIGNFTELWSLLARKEAITAKVESKENGGAK